MSIINSDPFDLTPLTDSVNPLNASLLISTIQPLLMLRRLECYLLSCRSNMEVDADINRLASLVCSLAHSLPFYDIDYMRFRSSK
jgi:hypothetical protein